MTEENREQDSNAENTVNRGDAAHFDRTEHPGPISEETNGFRPDSILEKTMRPLTFDNFKCKVCRKRKETRKQGKSATSQNVICLDCFNQGLRLIMETSRRTDNTPQTVIVDSKDETTRSILPNPDQPKGAVIIDLETGEQTWPTEDEEDSLQQMMPLGSSFKEPAKGDEEDMAQPETESRPDPDDPEHAHKFSHFPGEIHYHLEVPGDPSTVKPGQKFIHIGNTKRLKEIWQDYNEARRRSTQIKDQLGIERDQISVKKCECYDTYWPDQPREAPPPSRQERWHEEQDRGQDPGKEGSNNGAPPEEPTGAPQASNNAQDPEDPATGMEEASQDHHGGAPNQQGSEYYHARRQDNPNPPGPFQGNTEEAQQEHERNEEQRETPAEEANHVPWGRKEGEEDDPSHKYQPRPRNREEAQETQMDRRVNKDPGWTREDEITKNEVFLESVNNQMRHLNEDVAGNQTETIIRRLVQIKYLINSWLRE